MLISNLKGKDVRGGMEKEVLLIPELCYATGEFICRNNLNYIRKFYSWDDAMILWN